MRVLLTTDTIGGVWTFNKELTTNLLRLGHAVALVSFGYLPSSDQSSWCSATAAAYPSAFRYEASSVPLEWMAGNETVYAQGESLLLRLVREFAPDVLHSSQFCFGKLPVSIPKLITAHSDVLTWADACRRNGLEPSPWLTRYRVLVDEGLEGADGVAAPTQWMLDALSGHFPMPQLSDVILNGRNLVEVRSTEARALQAVSVGRLWDEAKNTAMITQVASPLPILVAGEQKHEDAVASCHLGRVGLLGVLAEEDLLALFRASSVYIAASIYEPFGLAPLEAALCGCAVVSNDIASLREIWGDAALYFSDPASLESLLHWLHASPTALSKARLRSKQRARQLTASRMTNEYLRFYSELLSPNSIATRESVQPPILAPIEELVTYVS